MRLTIADETARYVPEYGGNREGDEPAVFVLRPLNAGQTRQHRLRVARMDRAKRRDDINDEIEAVIAEGIASIEGLVVRRVRQDGGHDDEQCTTGAAFMQHAPELLKLEIYEALTNAVKLDGGVDPGKD